MEKRYTLPVAIAVVVGTVIGSGIFFKAEAVLTKTGGNLSIGILAFIIMGVVMIISACTFGIVAQSHEGVEGLVGFAKASCGKTFSYYVGWFMAIIYYPSLVGVLSWLPARYFGVLMGWDDAVIGGRTLALAGGFMIVTYTMNALAPKLAGKFAICTTVIKLIPLLLMAVVGTIVGLSNGMTSFNFSNIVTEMPFTEGLFGAIVSLAFAFEGWICATTIGPELKDSKKNLPRALLIGTVIVAIVYVVYYIGLGGAVESEVMMQGGEAGAKIAFQNIFGQVGGAAIFVFVVISCWGTCNGLTMAATRGMFDLATESGSPKLAMFKTVDPATGMASNSAVLGLLMSVLWLLYFYFGTILNSFGPVMFDSSELPIITLYALYIPIYIALMKRSDLSAFRGKVMPVLAILCSVFMVFAAIYSHKWNVAWYLGLFLIIEIIGSFFKGKKA
jgi:APA family basic amino acid/polyamine antiporter